MRKFYTWWVSVLLIATGAFWAHYFGVIQTIVSTDVTYITSIIAAVFVICNLSLGYYSYKLSDPWYSRERLSKLLDMNWFMSEQMMALGMLGTVIGLIHMLATNFVTDTSAMQGMLSEMWKAMGLALYTNAVGIVASIILKLQVYFLSYGENDETQEV